MARERVLIVEDETIVQLHLSSIVERLGYEVSGLARSADEALESVRRAPPDFILMDIRLDGAQDGIALAQQIRMTRDVPIIYLTAYADEETVARARQTEPAAYLTKPFTEESVRATLVTALTKDHVLRETQERERWLMRVLESVGDGVLVIDRQGSIRFLSEPTAQLVRVSREGIVGRQWREALPLDQQSKTLLHAMVARPAAERSRVSARLSGRGHHERWVDIDVRDDPSDASRRILLLYDTSEIHELRRLLREQEEFQGMLGRSAPMQRVFDQIREVAAVDWTVLIEGETGTGKELVAHAIHASSPRKHGPFVAVNCGGLTESLVASQLFGHRKGAFTGAVSDQRGLFEAANGGTLFLDELGDIPLNIQTTLLRVLEDRLVTPLGSSTPRKIDVRLLAATHRDLATEVEHGRFRTDLLYRIRVVRIALPPLRDRIEDFPLLAHWFLDRARATAAKRVERISDAAMTRLRAHPWPGNVRELKSAIDFAVIRCRGAAIEPEDLPPEISGGGPPADGAEDPRRLLAALGRAAGNRTRAAQMLGISRATFYRRLQELGTDPE